jgi:hypothetical protein
MMNLKNLREGITDDGTPDMKYYAFDWDDNIVIMPTKIIVKDEDGNEVGMSTDDFAHYRMDIGENPFEYNGRMIVGYSDEPFKYFGVQGDKQFIIDSLLSKPGPAWNDFVEAINNGSIFAIVTARGHTPSIIKDACYNFIVSNHNGINSNELIKNLEKFREISDKDEVSKVEMIREYLDMCRFYPVSYKSQVESKPEESKVIALEEFINYIKKASMKIQKKAFLKNKISNFFLPTVGFSDDDIRNVEKVKSHFSNDPENILKTYSTSGGEKKLY